MQNRVESTDLASISPVLFTIVSAVYGAIRGGLWLPEQDSIPRFMRGWRGVIDRDGDGDGGPANWHQRG